MSIRLDPRRVSTLKQLAGDAGVRPGDLVRQWVEERIDAVRQGLRTPASASDLATQLSELAARVAALESAGGIEPPVAGGQASTDERGPVRAMDADAADGERHAAAEITDAADATDAPDSIDAAGATQTADATEAAASVPAADATPYGADVDDAGPGPDAQPGDELPRRRPVKRVAASPSTDRVALHDEMIAVLSEHGPMTAGELAALISERGRYSPPRSGRSLDAAMVSQRVSNPTYRSRFVRDGGRIGLAQPAGESAE